MTLRGRLAAWYGALLASVLAFSLGVVYLEHQAGHAADIDAVLSSAVDAAAIEIAEDLSLGASLDRLRPSVHRMSAEPLAVWAYVPGAASVGPAADPRDPRLADLDPRSAPAGYATTLTTHGRVRTYADALDPSGIVVVAAVSLVEADASLADLSTTLVTLGAAAIALATWGGLAMSGAVLGPLAAMTDAARGIAASRDLSRRVKVASPSDDELGTLAETFNEMLASLDEAHRAQQRFVADASHEIRTPLAALRGGIELLERADDPAERDALAAHVRTEVERLSRLVEDLLALARADAGAPAPAPVSVDLDEVVMEAFADLRRVAGARLRMREIERVVVQGDRDRLKQLALILIDNALRYAPGAPVEISLVRNASSAVLRIDDEGIGLTEEDVARAFERFYRGRGARAADPSGSGLGLAIARGIAQGHGGDVSIAQRSPKGTTALATIPT